MNITTGLGISNNQTNYITLGEVVVTLAVTNIDSAESDPRLCRLGVNPPAWMVRIAQRFIIDYNLGQYPFILGN